VLAASLELCLTSEEDEACQVMEQLREKSRF